jgi:hypothetical protein
VLKGSAAITAALLGLGILLVAPALSLRPYVPEPVEFELRARPAMLDGPVVIAAARGGERFRVLRSRALETPKRFNLVGFRWRGANDVRLWVRTGSARGWSEWRRLPTAGDNAPDDRQDEGRTGWRVSRPLWAGDAGRVQFKLASRTSVRDLRLHFVNSKGTATGFDALRTRLRRAAHGAVASVAGLLGAGAAAAAGQPAIVSREAWGASKCPPRATPGYGSVQLAFIHHTVTANEYGPEDSAAMVLGICRYHRNSNGWNDIGYQFLVDRYGTIFEGRAGGIDQAVVGAQAQGYNSVSTGIASLGTFSTDGQTEPGLSALARLLSWKLGVHGLPSSGSVVVRSAGGSSNKYPAGTDVRFDRISGHRDGDATSCPGDGLYAQLPRLRSMVDPVPGTATQLSLGAARGRLPYGRKARLQGKLRAADGRPLGSQPVRIEALGVGKARSLARAATNADGSFSASIRLVFNRTLLARFAGAPGLKPAASSPVRIGIRPRVSASIGVLAGALVRRGQRVTITGSVRPRKRTAVLLVDRQGSDGAFRRTAGIAVKVRLGQIRAAYRARRPGTYRLRLGVLPDGRNLGARSEPLTLKVGR